MVKSRVHSLFYIIFFLKLLFIPFFNFLIIFYNFFQNLPTNFLFILIIKFYFHFLVHLSIKGFLSKFNNLDLENLNLYINSLNITVLKDILKIN
jgi:hypothetical protein